MSKKQTPGATQPAEIKVGLVLQAGKATPAPPVGTALGPKGINLVEFCKKFNDQCKADNIEVGSRVKILITIKKDKSFSFEIKTPPVSDLIKKYAGVEKGSSATKKEKNIGSIKISDCRKIAEIKLVDLNTDDIETAIGIIVGSALSMGISVIQE